VASASFLSLLEGSKGQIPVALNAFSIFLDVKLRSYTTLNTLQNERLVIDTHPCPPCVIRVISVEYTFDKGLNRATSRG
jgi:hypothetical protein